MSKFERMSKVGSSKSKYANLGREKLAASLTCPLCNHLFSHPTTITSCLHTFCKQCIHGKIINEQCRHCPICNIDIGVNPLTKLRSENSLNELRRAVLGTFGRSTKKEVVINHREENEMVLLADEDASSSLPPPPERLEQSLTSMVLGVPRVPTAAMVPIKRRSKSGRKKGVLSSQGSILPLNEPSVIAGDFPVISYSPAHHANPANNSAQPEKCIGPQSASSNLAKAPEPSKGSLETIGSIEGSSLSKSSIPLKTSEVAKKIILDFDLNELPLPSPPSSPVGLSVPARPSTSERARQQRRRRLVPKKKPGLPADDVLPSRTDALSIQPTQTSIPRGIVVLALKAPEPPTRTAPPRTCRSLPSGST